MYIMSVPVLSTAHIRPATSEFLTDEGNDVKYPLPETL